MNANSFIHILYSTEAVRGWLITRCRHPWKYAQQSVFCVRYKTHANNMYRGILYIPATTTIIILIYYVRPTTIYTLK